MQLKPHEILDAIFIRCLLCIYSKSQITNIISSCLWLRKSDNLLLNWLIDIFVTAELFTVQFLGHLHKQIELRIFKNILKYSLCQKLKLLKCTTYFAQVLLSTVLTSWYMCTDNRQDDKRLLSQDLNVIHDMTTKYLHWNWHWGHWEKAMHVCPSPYYAMSIL